MPKLAFFVGKGGVGKTTLSSAYAVQSATSRRSEKVLLLSTDPAHSLADLLRTKLGDSPRAVKVGKGTSLVAWQMNAVKRFNNFFGRHREEILEAIERGSIFTREEIASLLETSLPGMAEIAALLTIQDALASGKYSSIVVDTAPFGHTLRLFAMPSQFLRLLKFLELAADRDRVIAEHFGGRASQRSLGFIETWHTRISELENALAQAEIFLVTTAEKFSLNESLRCIPELRTSNPGIKVKAIVLNRVILRAGKCSLCRSKVKQADAARKIIRENFPSAKLYIAEDPGVPILGMQTLRRFAAGVFFGKRVKWSPVKDRRNTARVRLQATKWPARLPSLSLVLGKGGVGKTTVAAGLGFCARAGHRATVELCSVDPAPSLDDVFQTKIDDHPRSVLLDRDFLASELDTVALFRNWIADLKFEFESVTSAEYSGIHVDLSYERELFSQLLDIVPPGVDELLAVFRIADLLGTPSKKIIIDMAPTGHALELLRMPERVLIWSRLLLKTLAVHRKLALARTAAVKIAEMEVRARELSRVLKDSKQSAVWAVMLPEFLPDRETQSLLTAVGQLKLPAEALFVNRVLLPGQSENCARCRAISDAQAEVLAGLRTRYPGKRIYVIREFGGEIAGAKRLQDLTRELWQLN